MSGQSATPEGVLGDSARGTDVLDPATLGATLRRMTAPAERLTTGQVALRLGLSRARVVQLAIRGSLECERTPLGRLFDAASVEREAESRGLTGSGMPPEVRQ